MAAPESAFVSSNVLLVRFWGHRTYDRAALRFRGLNADINFDKAEYEGDMSQVPQTKLYRFRCRFLGTSSYPCLAPCTLFRDRYILSVHLLCMVSVVRLCPCPRRNSSTPPVARAPDSHEAAPNIEESLCTSVAAGRRGWDNFWGRSEPRCPSVWPSTAMIVSLVCVDD